MDIESTNTGCGDCDCEKKEQKRYNLRSLKSTNSNQWPKDFIKNHFIFLPYQQGSDSYKKHSSYIILTKIGTIKVKCRNIP